MNAKSFHYLSENRLAIAELSPILSEEELHIYLPNESMTGKWYFFNRLNVPAQIRKQGFGTKLMNDIVAWADTEHINIINTVNPYGEMNMNQLITFYKKYGFKSLKPKGLMIRRCL